MKTLDELLKEKKELDKQIREIKEQMKDKSVYTSSKEASFYKMNKNCYNQDDEKEIWAIGINSINIGRDKQKQRVCLISGYDKEKVICALPEVIKELRELFDILNAEELK